MTKSRNVGRGGVPPEEHRWPKGQSGNARGRPKRRRDEGLLDMLRTHLGKQVWIVIDGKRQKMSMLEAASALFANDLFKGSAADRRRSFEWLIKNKLADKIAEPKLLDPVALRKFVDELANEARLDEEVTREFGPYNGINPNFD